MEDEDGEGSNVDSWTIHEKLSYKDNLYICDEKLHNKIHNVNEQEDKSDVDMSKNDISMDDNIFNSTILFKGFKKRILAQTQDNDIPEKVNNQDECITPLPKTSKDKNNDNKRGKITEYAQYLGLQPTGKYKCPKCNPVVTFRSMSMLMQHQCVCTSASNPIQGVPSTSEQHEINTTTNTTTTSSSSSLSSTNNFRISRKVYLCAACGTYFENWNLFLHMREIHKRHICLFCLGMFGQAERLSHHLMKKHSVPETKFHTIDDFYAVFKDSCYLICCTCEKVFSETDDFYTHTCVNVNQRIAINTLCSLCRQTDGTHSSKCKLGINFERKNINERIQASDSEQTLFPNPANAVAKKLLGANRSRLENNERALLSSYNRKLLDMYAKKISLKSKRHNSKIHNNEWNARGTSSIDMINKTASIYTSKYDNSRNHNRLLASNNSIKERHIVEIDVTKSPAYEKPTDRYTDTIMQVSQYGDELDSNDGLRINEEFDYENIEDDEEKDINDIREIEDGEIDSGDENDDDYDRINNFNDMSEDMEQGELILDDGNDDTPDESPPVSPKCTNFTPNKELSMRAEEQLHSSTLIDEPSTCSMPKESPNVTVSRVNSTNRSLVIKICTNKNSQFTVATPNGNGNYENNSKNEDENRANEADDDIEDEEEEEDDNDDDDDDDDDDNDDDDDDVDDDDEHEEDGESEQNNNAGQVALEKEVSASDSDNGKLDVMSPKESSIENKLPSIPPSPLLSTSPTPTAIQTETLTSTAIVIPDESPLITNTEKKIDEMSETNDMTFEPHFTLSEPTLMVPDNTLVNINIKKSTDTMVQDESMKLSPNKIDQIECEVQQNKVIEEVPDGIKLATDEIQCIDLNVSGTLDSIEIEDLLKHCINAASSTCIYCNHARHIAVNGKQLALHMLAEHRFQPQHPAIIIQRDQFNMRVKKSLDELTLRWFNLDSYDDTRGTYNISTVKTYECYLCRIYYTFHKELYLHNRKMHQKTILICIMCKSTFYSHSELLCHLCPGVYASHINIKYRCCLCDIKSLPSAFRLMVHLRKRHHACDVCLESTGNQQRLSNHVWKHKLHHLCYRCGIAYRNKPDITKHLFWKHGTESVLCKKCLQKKWPHIYHFCIPPSAFVCEECGSTFSRAVALKVHKRLHSGDRPHSCSECSTSFISKKLLSKHDEIHKPPPPPPPPPQFPVEIQPVLQQYDQEQTDTNTTSESNKIVINSEQSAIESIGNANNKTAKTPKESVRKVLDVYDLPPLNLSSDSDSDMENEKIIKTEDKCEKVQNNEEMKKDIDMVEINENNNSNNGIAPAMREQIEINSEKISENIIHNETNDSICDIDESNEEETKKEEVVIMNGIWDNFKSYTASLESKEMNNKTDIDSSKNEEILSVIVAEHDYCVVYGDDSKEEGIVSTETNVEVEHDDIKTVTSPSPSINANGDSDMMKRKTNKSLKKKTKQSQEDGGGGASSSSSDSSSDSNSSSCSCGTNCSCSSSSSGSSSSSSSSSDSDSSTSESSPKKSSVIRKDRRKDKDSRKTRTKDLSQLPPPPLPPPPPPLEDIEVPVQTENGIQSTDDVATETAVNVTDETITENNVPPTPAPIRESDLETDETETDEDFYDEYPQQHANNLLAEKRNQLMLLATVAPPSADDSALGSSSNDMKNGTITTSNDKINTLQQPQPIIAQTKTNVKRKIKTKRRKKGEGGRGRGRPPNIPQVTIGKTNPAPVIESIKLNIPKFLYRNKQSGVRKRLSSPHPKSIKSREPKLPAVTYQLSQPDLNINQQTPSKTLTPHNSSNDNENISENKRSSKRKRVPKRFYGDSSDEEQQRQPNSITQKWRRVDTHVSTIPYVPSITIKQNYGPPTSTAQPTKFYQTVPSVPISPEPEVVATPAPPPIPVVPIPEPAPVPSVSDSEDLPDDSSSDSSASETEPVRHPPRQHPGGNESQGTAPPNRQANLYCYCQCPYDEVSEMIACDGNNCRIEWFHFECVGIMVPPKGKWYCPDCSKNDSTLPSNEFFD